MRAAPASYVDHFVRRVLFAVRHRPATALHIKTGKCLALLETATGHSWKDVRRRKYPASPDVMRNPAETLLPPVCAHLSLTKTEMKAHMRTLSNKKFANSSYVGHNIAQPLQRGHERCLENGKNTKPTHGEYIKKRAITKNGKPGHFFLKNGYTLKSSEKRTARATRLVRKICTWF